MEAIYTYKLGFLDRIPASFVYLKQIDNRWRRKETTQLLKCPCVLPANLLFLFRGEVILDVERLAYLLRCLALDHVCHRLTSQIQQALDVQIDLACDVRERDAGVGTVIFNHMFDCLGFQRHRFFNLEGFTVGALENDDL
ncbi:hypothetical protein Ccrd_017631 [Cynara cardunculus var. scolymus]|uniref:Uncharacterized protein n=1 Tax=Cynara cardunculus var. scolymus TaxID=59895 RepID=A0A103Y7Q3_CYNCS|nr:hypothetical protein Ccrd_017631 [Cynara cardunculus var. scolymus]